MIVVARIDFGSWLWRLVAWDGLLPVLIWLTPTAIEAVLPNLFGPIALAAVVLPIGAVFLRFRSGKRHIAANRCSRLERKAQLGIFVIGIFPLTLIDCVVMLTHVMPAGAATGRDDLTVGAVLLSIYLTAMIIAMYPGRLCLVREPTSFTIPEFERDVF